MTSYEKINVSGISVIALLGAAIRVQSFDKYAKMWTRCRFVRRVGLQIEVPLITTLGGLGDLPTQRLIDDEVIEVHVH